MVEMLVISMDCVKNYRVEMYLHCSPVKKRHFENILEFDDRLDMLG